MSTLTEIMSAEIDKISSALSKAQGEIDNVIKDKSANQGKYKYADLAACLSAIKEPFSKNGLAVSQLVSIQDNKQVLITLLMHDSGQWIKSIFRIESVVVKTKDGGLVNNPLQELGAGLTYVRRYALSAIVGLAQEDNDAADYTDSKKDQSLAAKLREACITNNLDPAEFAAAYNITSKNEESVRLALSNFSKYKVDFLASKLKQKSPTLNEQGAEDDA